MMATYVLAQAHRLSDSGPLILLTYARPLTDYVTTEPFRLDNLAVVPNGLDHCFYGDMCCFHFLLLLITLQITVSVSH